MRFYESQVTRLIDATGRMRESIGVMGDVTEARRLKNRWLQYARVFQGASEGMLLVAKGAHGELRYHEANPAVGTIVGVDPAAIVGERPADVFPASFARKVERLYCRARAATVRDAGPAPTRHHHLDRRHHPGDRVLRDLVGLGVAGHRLHYSRPQGRSPKPQRIFWAIIEGAIAIALLLGGGLKALQSAAVSTGLPFTLVLMVACYALVKALLSEPRAGLVEPPPKDRAAPAA